MDRSLDEFATPDTDEGTTDAETDDDAPADGGPAGGEETPADAAADAGETDPTDDGEEPSLTVRAAESTMDWTPDGAACAACEATVERRWRDDGRLVCLDCKQW
ncbi:DUF7573 domain-containing protein [Halomarina oriensis]|uniref:DUF7573 domain-containing protein n=1 Tax=Halomarina oriensis TaxID=671145 RepID=A0A6B0GVM8_9EURY|nr:hypothetical protein [Halomarina oriensis]MWG36643.1 hypothetical protein [Halomarina oriensis]